MLKPHPPLSRFRRRGQAARRRGGVVWCGWRGEGSAGLGLKLIPEYMNTIFSDNLGTFPSPLSPPSSSLLLPLPSPPSLRHHCVHPGACHHTGQHPGATLCVVMHPDAAACVGMNPGAHINTRQHPGATSNEAMHPGAATCVDMHPGAT
jgi:hypothetical protein